MTEQEVLLPAETAPRLGSATRVVIQAMYERRLPRVKLEDGTLGIPADALDSFHVKPIGLACDDAIVFEPPHVARFLAEDLRMAQVAAVSRAGVPLLGSLWFVFDDDRFWFTSHPSSPFVAAVQRNVDLAVLIDQFDPPDRIRQVRVRGPGQVEAHDARRVRQIYERYLGRDVGEWPDFFRERVDDPTWTLWSVSPVQGVATMYPDFREQSTRWDCFADSPFAAS